LEGSDTNAFEQIKSEIQSDVAKSFSGTEKNKLNES
jgi:hypothetical protein